MRPAPPPSWLPPLLTLESCGGDVEAYFDVLHNRLRNDLDQCRWQGIRVVMADQRMYRGKEETFWHVTSSYVKGKGLADGERQPDLRRCERIGWIRPLIETCDAGFLKSWVSATNRRMHICISGLKPTATSLSLSVAQAPCCL